MSERDDRDPITRTDHLRLSPALVRRVHGFKEWTYFYVSGPELDLLVTLTFLGRIDVGATSPLPSARVVALARTVDGRWSGGVEEVPPSAVAATPGRIDIAMGASELTFRDGSYTLTARLAAAGISARLRLQPQSQPAIGTSVRMGAAEPMRWIVVPRLLASGALMIGAREYAVADALAYHDHNWGAFSWGGDFAWEWGLILGPRDGTPWTIVYSRISDRFRQRVRSQAILVWRGDDYYATFRDDEVSVRETGLVRGGARLRIPPVMSLVEPATTADVPEELTAVATSGVNRLEIRFTTSDFAEIAIPNETPDLGSTLLCEGAARAHVKGSIRGEDFAFEAPALLELNHAALGPRPPAPRGGGPQAVG